MSAPLRLVLDTNVIIDIFRFRDPSTGPLAKALEQGHICCLTDEGCLEELRRVLAYPKLKMDPEGAAALWDNYAARTEHIAGSGWPEHLPQCQDQDDQRFIELAARGGAHWLVSKDKLVLRVRRSGLSLPFEILRPDEAIQRLAAVTALAA